MWDRLLWIIHKITELLDSTWIIRLNMNYSRFDRLNRTLTVYRLISIYKTRVFEWMNHVFTLESLFTLHPTIKWKSFVSYFFEQNDIAKRQNRTIIEKLKVMLIDVDLIDNFWEKIFYTIIYFRNRFSVIKLRIREIDKIFYEIWIGDRFELNHLRIIECDAWHHISKKISSQKKFNDRIVKCQLLRYAEINQYKLWNSISKKMIVSKNVIFDESKLLRMIFIDCHWSDVNDHDDATAKNNENDDVTSSFFSSSSSSSDGQDDFFPDVVNPHSETGSIDFDFSHVDETKQHVSFTNESNLDSQSNESRLGNEPNLDESYESKITVHSSPSSTLSWSNDRSKKNALLKRQRRTINWLTSSKLWLIIISFSS